MNKLLRDIPRWGVMAVGTVILLVLLLPAVLYIPFVQNKAKDVACDYAREHMGMDITIGRLLLKFPLNLSLDSVTVTDTSKQGTTDTMAVIGNFTGGVEVLPLLKQDLSFGTVKLESGYYHMVSNDSSMLLKARIDHAVVKGAEVDLKSNIVNLLSGDLSGGFISLTQNSWKKEIEPDTAQSAPWLVNVLRLTARDLHYTMRMLPTVDTLSAHVGFAQLDGGFIDTGEHTVKIDAFNVDSVLCTYDMMSDRDTWIFNSTHLVPVDTSTSAPWSIDLGYVGFKHVDYSMRMLPTIDRLKAALGQVSLDSARINMGAKLITAQKLQADSLDCRYFLPGNPQLTSLPEGVNLSAAAAPDTASPWTVLADTIRLTRSHVLYTTTGMRPQAGLDPNYIELSEAGLKISSLYNQGSDIRLRIDSLRLRERCGLQVRSASCTFAMNNGKIDVNNLRLLSGQSNIFLDAHAPMTLFDTQPWGSFDVTTRSKVSLAEVALIMPSVRTVLKPVPQRNPVEINARITGTPQALQIAQFSANLPGYAHASAIGAILHPLDTKKMNGNVDFNLAYTNIDFVKSMALTKEQAQQINLPPLTAKGNVHFTADSYAGNLAMHLRNGSLAGKGAFYGNTQGYNLDAQLVHFPVQAIMPSAPVDDITGHIALNGHGFGFLNANTAVNAEVKLDNFAYNGQNFSNITANVDMANGKIAAYVDSHNKNADFSLNADGQIDGSRYVFTVNGLVRDVDAQALGFTDVQCSGSGQISGFFDYDSKTQQCNVDADMSQLRWAYDGSDINSDATTVKFVSTDKEVQAFIDNEDTHLDFASQCSLKDFIATLERTASVAQEQIKNRDLDINALQHALPVFTLDLKSGPNGIVPRYLAAYGIDFRAINCQIKNDSTLYMDGYVHSLAVGSTAIDTITFHANELNKYLAFNVHMGNRPGTWDDFAQVDVNGGAVGSTVDFLIEHHDIEGKRGYYLGANATLADNVIKVRLFPNNPVIAYRDWELNDSNYINFNYTTRMIDADFALKSDSSSLALRTEATDDPNKTNVLLNVKHFNIEEWLGSNMLMTPIGGTVDADMKFAYDGQSLDGNGVVSIKNFSYDNIDEGDIALNADLFVDPATRDTKLNATIDLDGQQVALAYGTLADSTHTNPLDVNVQFMRFPLVKASPFIPGNMLRLQGYIGGGMTVTGSLDAPVINGYVQGDSAIVALPAYGCTLRLCDDKIPVTDGKVELNNYQILGINNQAVNVSGYYDINSSVMDIHANGQNVQVIGSEQKRFSEVFGKGFADINAMVTGDSENTDVRASVTLLPETNLTYVMQDEVTTLSTSTVDENMVTFINPNDTLSQNVVLKTLAATSSSSSNIVIDIGIDEGAKLGAYLSTDGKDRVTVEGSGRLRYSLDFAGKDNLVGTYTISQGNVRYSPPIISQKVFDISSGSYIKWTGEMMNPQLNVNGTEKIKASVTGTDGNSRVVEFLVTAMVGNTLNNIDLQFDMSTDNDMTVQNELQSMTDTQRSNAAINLLLYNTYSGMNSSNMNLSSTGALYSFLQSQLNGWAAKTLKGVDLTFGINQYDNSSNGKSKTETSYSYRLSKSLFNDRFKVVVGGEYSTDATSEENFSNNLINDISFEYDLNASGTRYFRLFRHTGFESVLEGEVTETGVGLVLKRKLSTLHDFFRFNFFKSDSKTELPTIQPAPNTETTEPQEQNQANDDNTQQSNEK